MNEKELIIKAKLVPPRLPVHMVPRPRLTSRLNDAVAGGYRFLLMTGSVGYGKTVTATEWLQQAGKPFVWMTLDKMLDDSDTFSAYLKTAIALSGLTEYDRDACSSGWVDCLYTLDENGEEFALVLDDFFGVTTPEILDGLAALIESPPAMMTLVIISREDPPFPLSRYRLHDVLFEIRESDLVFTEEETIAFFEQFSFRFDNRTAHEIHTLIEGWPAGLKLCALSMQRWPGGDPYQSIRRFSGGNNYIIEYFLDEILATLPPDLKDFVGKVGILNELNSDLCDYLTGRGDSADLLRRVEKSNLLVRSVGQEGNWYRVHNLLAAFFRSRLPTDEQEAVRQKADEWYAALNAGEIRTGDTILLPPAASPAAVKHPAVPLSRRETEIIRLAALGRSNHDIAEKLFISLGTVKWHMNNIFRKLGAGSRTQAVHAAEAAGLLGNGKT